MSLCKQLTMPQSDKITQKEMITATSPPLHSSEKNIKKLKNQDTEEKKKHLVNKTKCKSYI